MTDANGTRTSRTGDAIGQNPLGSNSNGHGSNSQSPNSQRSSSQSTHIPGANGRAIERPPLRIPSSQFSPNAPTSRPGIKPKTNAGTNGKTGAEGKPNDKPKTRYRAGEEQPTRRTRRSRNNGSKGTGSRGNGAKSDENGRRRLFGTVPDRIKSKSSSRTRALKAKTGRPGKNAGEKTREKKGARSPQKLGSKSPSQTSGKTPGVIAKKTLGETAANKRPNLPNPSYPGRVPPARSIIRKRRRSSKSTQYLRKGIQFFVVGLGIAVLGGSLINARPNQSTEPVEPAPVAVEPVSVAKTFPLTLGQEIPGLKASLQELPNLYPSLTPKIFYIDVDTGNYVSVEGSETVAAASTIKLPILLAFFEEVDAGRIDPNQTLALAQPDIAEGSGDMQLSPPGTQFTALEVASQMIINSDNTATNMMIGLLGGKEILNNWFQTQGLEKTVINAPLPDLDGTNTTSSKDLVHTMLLISQGEELEMRSRDRILNILNRTYNKSLLAAGPQERGALTYNKTGDIASVLGDVALVDLPNGKRYAIASLVERPTNDGRALEMIRRISGQTYEEAAKAVQPAVTPLGNPDGATPANSPANNEENPATSTTPSSTGDSPTTSPESQLPEEEPYPSANPDSAGTDTP